MFILNPDQYLVPDYKISPFQTKDIAFNNSLPHDTSIDSYLKERFTGRDFIYTSNGRSALNKALAHYKLQKEDTITILTTSGNFYVSNCVTSEAEKFCKWNREVIAATKVIIVVHEFGYPFTGWEEVLKYNLPVIEDCAYSFFSEDSTNSINRTGEFAVYSFPKMFPLQVGGLLSFQNGHAIQDEDWENSQIEGYIKKVLSFYIKKKDEIIQDRMRNYRFLQLSVKPLGFEGRFELMAGIVPGVFMFRLPGEQIDLVKLKEQLVKHGIQCSVFYGENSFFIPVHQSLAEADLKYIVAVIQSFI